MRKLFFFCLLFISLFVIAGCKKNDQNSNNQNVNHEIEIVDFDKDAKVEITFWHSVGQTSYNYLQDLIDSFNVYFPNIKVNAISHGDMDTLFNDINNVTDNSNLPTIAQTGISQIPVYMKNDIIANLDPYLNSTKPVEYESGEKDIVGITQEEQNKLIPGFFKEGRTYNLEGTLYSLPFQKSTEVLYYNKTLFDKYGWNAPITWDDVINLSKDYVLTSEYKNAYAIDKNISAFSCDSKSNLFINLTKQWESEYIVFDQLGSVQILYNNDLSKEGLSFYQEQFNKGYFATPDKFSVDYASYAFLNKQVIMAIGNNSGLGYYLPKDKSFEVGVSTYPQANINNPQVIQQGTNISLFRTDNSQEALAGWLFMKYLMSYEAVMMMSKTTSFYPIRKDVLESNEYKEYFSKDSTRQMLYNACAKQQDWIFTYASFDKTLDIHDSVSKIVYEILYDNKSIDKAYNDSLTD